MAKCAQEFYAPWNVSEDDFPKDGTLEDKIAFCVTYAVLAPSNLNTQPWQFKVFGDTAYIYFDRRRGLAVLDPDDRGLWMSCAAALFNLRLAIRHFGYGDVTETLPNPDDEDLLAKVKITENSNIEADELESENRLFEQVTKWRFTRAAFKNKEVPEDVLRKLRSEVAKESAWLHVCSPFEKENIARLIAEGDHAQMGNKQFRRELASWLNKRRCESGDGMVEFVMQNKEIMEKFDPLLLRRFEASSGGVVKDDDIANGCPVLAVLGSTGGRSANRIAAGQAFSRLVLRAYAEGLSVSYLNQPCEVPALRLRLHDELAEQGRAQVILRIGYPKKGEVPAQNPRRLMEDVLRMENPEEDADQKDSVRGGGFFGGFKKFFGRNAA